MKVFLAMSAKARGADPRDVPRAAAGELGLSGCYSLFTARSAVTGPAGADPVYHAETRRLRSRGSPGRGRRRCCVPATA
ncbi:hypothetical protein ACIBHX_08135 [Nonomuraea sp. NPDC050536]|uniref:hypothetical protein n=1 Tax=Nonomuraea sp. NPDC050536 TaxID=3364366 RepID=UPI0037C86412